MNSCTSTSKPDQETNQTEHEEEEDDDNFPIEKSIHQLSSKRKRQSKIPPEQFSFHDVDKTVICNYCQSVMGVHSRQGHMRYCSSAKRKEPHYNF